jgi:hypothetical protein
MAPVLFDGTTSLIATLTSLVTTGPAVLVEVTPPPDAPPLPAIVEFVAPPLTGVVPLPVTPPAFAVPPEVLSVFEPSSELHANCITDTTTKSRCIERILEHTVTTLEARSRGWQHAARVE